MSLPPRDNDRAPNIFDVLIRLIDVTYDLFQTGNIAGVIILGWTGWIMYVSYKLPAKDLAPLLGETLVFLKSEKFYLFPLGAALIISVAINIIQARIYKSHIKDLAETRKLLVHGLGEGKLKPLKNHHSSHYDIITDTVKTEDDQGKD